MNRKNILLIILGLYISGSTLAQEKRFFMPREIKAAYEAGTRAYDGKPGPNYWQNTVDYQIEARVEPETRQIEGVEKVTYHNNSPEDLNVLVVRLYYDVFRKANPRDSRVNPEDISDEGVELKSILLNGQEVNLESQQVQRSGTNLYIRLTEPIKKGESIEMEASWVQYIPLTNRRTGVADSTSFFVAYWYPQISVYDDVFGWDVEDYTLRTEFYNNLANFDVTISAPESFTVWATGVLQNPDEVYPENVLAQYNKALDSEETVQILQASDLEGGYQNASGTWRFKAEEVSDFAFALSDHYLWDAAIQKVDGRDVLISSVFPDQDAAQYAELTATQQKIMKHFSEDFPGIPYPYPRFTSFMGLQGGGMEFPMMAYNQNENLGLTAHEMYHTYFPMYVRINERRFAWMDEGWAEYITAVVTERYWKDNQEPLFSNYTSSIQGVVGTYEDLPLITSSQFFDGGNYGYSAYPLPGFIYSVLHHHLGDETFLKAYQEYIRRWAKKSPTPYDFFYTFEDVSGEDLSWLWKPWFFEYGGVDVKVEAFKGDQLTISNLGKRPVPIQVDIRYQDNKEEKLILSASTWKDGSTQKLNIPNAKQVKTLSVNAGVVDGDIMDNFYPSLQEQVKGFDIPEGVFGSYLIQNYNIEMSVEKDEGLLLMRIPAAGMENYLMPQEDGRFASLDKMVLINFKAEDNQITGMEGELKQFNIKIQGKKQ